MFQVEFFKTYFVILPTKVVLSCFGFWLGCGNSTYMILVFQSPEVKKGKV
jgi:hypothetical protein